MADKDSNMATQNEIVLGENEMVCSLTNRVVKATEKEMTLQSMIAMMTEEYGFAPEDMERDFKVKYEDANEDKSKTQKVDLAIFNAGHAHDTDELIRFVIVAKDAKVKPNDKKAGVEATTEGILSSTDCDFACWTNGEDLQYVYSYEDGFGQVTIEAISDFPAEGQSLEDLEAQGERAMPRKPANESLVKTFKRCHDYIYGNEDKLEGVVTSCGNSTKGKVLAVKKHGSTTWEAWSGIAGFDYVDGYEYHLKINETNYLDHRMGEPVWTEHKLLDVLSKEKKETEGLPEDLIPEWYKECNE